MKKLLLSLFISIAAAGLFTASVFASSQSNVTVHVSTNGVDQKRTYTSENSSVHVYASASNGTAVISIMPQGNETIVPSISPTNTPLPDVFISRDSAAAMSPTPTPSIDWDLKSKETMNAFIVDLNSENNTLVSWIREWLAKHSFVRKTLFAFMRGGNEVPDSGDSDGFGVVRVKINTDNNEVCVRMRTWNIDHATAAHIHKAPEGQAGPVVVPLPSPDEQGKIQSCVSIDNVLANAIKNNPEEYYVNVHTDSFPNGAVRGQLH